MSSPIAGTLLTLAGIAGPSLLVTAAVRRWLEKIPWRFAALFLALVLLFLGRAVFTSALPVPVDEVARGYPYRGIFGPVVSANPLTNDTVKLFLPWMQAVREELSHGRFPLWNRYAFSGYPLLGNGESAPFSPLLLSTLFVPLPKQIVAMAGLKLFVALLFSYLFCKREGLGDAASSFAAIAFTFSTSQTVYLYYSTVSVTAFLPATLYAVSLGREGGYDQGCQTGSRIGGFFLMASVVAAIMANGHPESVLHIAIGTGALLFIDRLEAPDWKRWFSHAGRIALASVAGLLLSAPAWVPTLQQVLISDRLRQVRQLRYASFPFTAVWALVAPNGFGNPVRHNWSWILNYPLVAYSYIGLIPLALFITAAVARSTPIRVRCFVAVSATLFLVAMDWTVAAHAINAIPPLSIAANDKLRFVSVFFAVVVAAHLVDRPERYPRFVLATTGAALAALATYAYWKHAALMRPVDLAGAAAVLLMIALPRGRWVVTALTAVELFVLNVPFNAPTEARYFRPRLPIVAALRGLAPLEPFRILGLDWTFLPNAAAQYGLEDIRGSDPMALASYPRFFRLVEVDDPANDVKRVVDADKPGVDFLNVRFVLAEPGQRLSARWQLVYEGIDGTLFQRNDPVGRFFVPAGVLGPGEIRRLPSIGDFRREVVSDVARSENGPARIMAIEERSAGLFRLSVEAASSTFIASSQPLAPGWRVEVEGRRVAIHPVNGAFIGFFVPSGRSRVKVEYAPGSFYLSWWGVVAGVGLLVGVGRRVGRPSAELREGSGGVLE